MRTRSALSSALFLVLLPAGLHAESYGFGIVRKNVVVTSRLAPEVQLADVSISVELPRGAGQLDGNRLKQSLETILVQNGKNISLPPRDPQYEIQLTVTSSVRPHVEKKTEGKSTSYTSFGNATVAFRLVHRIDSKVIVSGTDAYQVGQGAAATAQKKVFGVAVPTLGGLLNAATTDEQVSTEVYDNLARRIGSHLVVLSVPIALPLAKGPDLDDLDKLAVALRWNEFSEKLATMPARPAGEDDAYRLYDMGVADEALGYAADDSKTTMKYLREASINYTRALEGKGTEKYFAESQARIERALLRYTSLEKHDREAKVREVDDQKAVAEKKAKKQAGQIDNEDVMKMVEAGLDPAIVVMKIRTAKVAEFDLTTDGLIDLAKHRVGTQIINEMTERMQPGSMPPPPPPGMRRR